MKQLSLDLKLINKDNSLKIWKNVPEKILIQIEEDVKSRALSTNDDLLYCSTCLLKLDNNTCPNCGRLFNNNSYSYIDIDNIDEYKKQSNRKEISHKSNYYVFDSNEDGVFLYIIICNHRNYWSNFLCNTWIKNVYYITEDYVFDIFESKKYYYEDLENINWEDIDSEEFDKYDFFNESITNNDEYCMYLNMDCLKNSIYRYSNIWNVPLDVLIKNKYLYSLTFIPLRIPQFEYFVKYGLYKLAFEVDKFDLEKKGINILEISKDFLSFIKKYDLDYEELQLLKMLKKKDIKYIRHMKDYADPLEFLSFHSIDISKVLDYFSSKNYELSLLYEYADYISMALKQGFVIDNSVLYPDDLMYEHNKLAERQVIINNPLVDENIHNVSNVLSFNTYEDDNYIIYPASSVDRMIDEASQQHNCLINYCDKYGNGNCQIFFLRKKSCPNKSFVTIELDSNNHIVQARGKYNEAISSDISKLIDEWQKSLTLITFE